MCVCVSNVVRCVCVCALVFSYVCVCVVFSLCGCCLYQLHVSLYGLSKLGFVVFGLALFRVGWCGFVLCGRFAVLFC